MKPLSIEQITQITGAKASGGLEVQISALCSLEDAREGGVCYVTSLDKPELLEKLQASALFVPAKAQEMPLPFKGILLYADNPEWAFILLMKYVDAQTPKFTPGIHPTAIISGKATLGKNVSVGAYSVIEDDVVIGDNTVIFPHVYVGKRTQIGSDCILYPQVVVREDCVLKNRVIFLKLRLFASES